MKILRFILRFVIVVSLCLITALFFIFLGVWQEEHFSDALLFNQEGMINVIVCLFFLVIIIPLFVMIPIMRQFAKWWAPPLLILSLIIIPLSYGDYVVVDEQGIHDNPFWSLKTRHYQWTDIKEIRLEHGISKIRKQKPHVYLTYVVIVKKQGETKNRPVTLYAWGDFGENGTHYSDSLYRVDERIRQLNIPRVAHPFTERELAMMKEDNNSMYDIERLLLIFR